MIHAHHAAGVLALAFASGCSGVDNIEVEAEGQTTVPEASVVEEVLGSVSFAGFQGFDISETQTFRNQGYTKDDIDSVRVQQFTLTVTDPPDGTFDFLNQIEFSAAADGLPAARMAWSDPVPEGANELVLEVDGGAELRPYVVAPEMTIETSANGVRPSEETTVSARVVLDVDVNVR